MPCRRDGAAPLADENRILRTGQADIEQTPLFRERVRIDSAAGVAVKQRIRAGEGQDALFQGRAGIRPGTQSSLGGVQGHDLHLLRLFAHKIQILPQAYPIKQPFLCLALFAERPEQGIAGRRFGEQRGEELGGIQMGGQRGRPLPARAVRAGTRPAAAIHVEVARAFRRGKGTLEAQPRQFKDEGGGRIAPEGGRFGAEQGRPGAQSGFQRRDERFHADQHGHFAGAARRGKRGIAAAGIFQRMGGSTEKKRNLIRDPCGFLCGRPGRWNKCRQASVFRVGISFPQAEDSPSNAEAEVRDSGGGTVACGERDALQRRPRFTQGGLNIGMRPTESVNGLIGVADAEEPMPVSGHQRPHKGNLQRRKVLYFVDQHVGPLAFRFGLQAGQPVLQQIRIVRKLPARAWRRGNAPAGADCSSVRGARRSRARDSSSHTRLASAADRALALANTLRAVSSGNTAGRGLQRSPNGIRPERAGYRPEATGRLPPKGAFKAFPELGGGAAGKKVTARMR